MTSPLLYFVAGLLAFPFPQAVSSLCSTTPVPLVAGAMEGDLCGTYKEQVLRSQKQFMDLDRLRHDRLVQPPHPNRLNGTENLYATLCKGNTTGNTRVVSIAKIFYTGAKPYPVTIMGLSPGVVDLAAVLNRPGLGPFRRRVATPLGPIVLTKNVPKSLVIQRGQLETVFRYLWVGGSTIHIARISTAMDSTAKLCTTISGRI